MDCPKLSDYNLFSVNNDPRSTPNDGGMAYKLNTPLFTDYAQKHRQVYVPKGLAAQYNASTAFEFPVGSIIAKSFFSPDGALLILNTAVELRLSAPVSFQCQASPSSLARARTTQCKFTGAHNLSSDFSPHPLGERTRSFFQLAVK